jgi:hypothetical protein
MAVPPQSFGLRQIKNQKSKGKRQKAKIAEMGASSVDSAVCSFVLDFCLLIFDLAL